MQPLLEFFDHLRCLAYSIFAARNMDRSIAPDYSHPQRLPDLPKVAIAGAEKGHQDFRVGDRNRCFKHQQKTAAEPP